MHYKVLDNLLHHLRKKKNSFVIKEDNPLLHHAHKLLLLAIVREPVALGWIEHWTPRGVCSNAPKLSFATYGQCYIVHTQFKNISSDTTISTAVQCTWIYPHVSNSSNYKHYSPYVGCTWIHVYWTVADTIVSGIVL